MNYSCQNAQKPCFCTDYRSPLYSAIWTPTRGVSHQAWSSSQWLTCVNHSQGAPRGGGSRSRPKKWQFWLPAFRESPNFEGAPTFEKAKLSQPKSKQNDCAVMRVMLIVPAKITLNAWKTHTGFGASICTQTLTTVGHGTETHVSSFELLCICKLKTCWRGLNAMPVAKLIHFVIIGRPYSSLKKWLNAHVWTIQWLRRRPEQRGFFCAECSDAAAWPQVQAVVVNPEVATALSKDRV